MKQRAKKDSPEKTLPDNREFHEKELLYPETSRKKRILPGLGQYPLLICISDMNYSATAVLSHEAQSDVLSHPPAQSAHEPEQVSSTGAASAFSELLQQAQEATANMPAAIAKVINTFFIIV